LLGHGEKMVREGKLGVDVVWKECDMVREFLKQGKRLAIYID
jgi:hypothetical protein